jgi:hypothetical protein|tara:strand:+ start:2122 stop:2334 length:213 start_codon:yes stop_codon:yes gene_type:complete
MGDSEIVAYLKDFDSQIKNLKLELMKVCWFLRGGMSWNEALVLSPGEREIVSQLVKENMETTKKSGQPFF